MENIERQNKITHALLAIIIILLVIILYWLWMCNVCAAPMVAAPAPVSNTTYTTNNTTTNKYYNYTNPALGMTFTYPTSWGQITTTTNPCPNGTVFVGTVNGMTFTGSSVGCVQAGTVVTQNGTDTTTGTTTQNGTTQGTTTQNGTTTQGDTTKGTDVQPQPPVQNPNGGNTTTVTTTSGNTGTVTQNPQNPNQQQVTFALQSGPYPTVTFVQGKNVSSADFMTVIKSVNITK